MEKRPRIEILMIRGYCDYIMTPEELCEIFSNRYPDLEHSSKTTAMI